MSPLNKNTNTLKNKDLANTKTQVDRKSDSKNANQTEKQPKINTSKLPCDLAEIGAVWPKLPEHIKAAINALIQTYNTEKR